MYVYFVISSTPYGSPTSKVLLCPAKNHLKVSCDSLMGTEVLITVKHQDSFAEVGTNCKHPTCPRSQILVLPPAPHASLLYQI